MAWFHRTGLQAFQELAIIIEKVKTPPISPLRGHLYSPPLRVYLAWGTRMESRQRLYLGGLCRFREEAKLSGSLKSLTPVPVLRVTLKKPEKVWPCQPKGWLMSKDTQPKQHSQKPYCLQGTVSWVFFYLQPKAFLIQNPLLSSYWIHTRPLGDLEQRALPREMLIKCINN